MRKNHADHRYPWAGSRPALIAILQDVQAENSYLSQENLELIAKELNVAISKVYGVATFFENFSLEAKGQAIWSRSATARHVMFGSRSPSMTLSTPISA